MKGLFLAFALITVGALNSAQAGALKIEDCRDNAQDAAFQFQTAVVKQNGVFKYQDVAVMGEQESADGSEYIYTVTAYNHLGKSFDHKVVTSTICEILSVGLYK